MRRDKSPHGFTLIEILIVILIIGITFGFALLAFGDYGENKRILFSAEQLVNTLRLAQQQAILQTSTLGLRIDNKSYQIVQLKNNSHWIPISNSGAFKLTYFPQNTLIRLKTNHTPSTKAPGIVIHASGDMTPFTLDFSNTTETNIASLRGRRNGELHLKVNNK